MSTVIEIASRIRESIITSDTLGETAECHCLTLLLSILGMDDEDVDWIEQHGVYGQPARRRLYQADLLTSNPDRPTSRAQEMDDTWLLYILNEIGCCTDDTWEENMSLEHFDMLLHLAPFGEDEAAD